MLPPLASRPARALDPISVFAREVAEQGGAITVSSLGDSAGAVAETRGLRHALLASPLLGVEHHVLLPVSFRTTVLLGLQSGGVRWHATRDPELATWLDGHPTLARLGEGFSWTCTLAPNAPPLRFDWLLQLRPAGGTFGQLVVRGGDYRGRSGVAEALHAAQLLCAAMGPEPHHPDGFITSPAFADAAGRALGLSPSTPPPAFAQATFVPVGGSASASVAASLVSAIHDQAPAPLAGKHDRESEHARRANQAGKLLLSGQTDGFIALWQSIVDELPDVGERGHSHYQLGSGYYLKKDFARALNLYEIAHSMGYDPKQCQKDIALCRAKMG